MKYQPEDLSDVLVINDKKLTHEDFPVNGQNFDSCYIYTCANGHEGAEPRVLPYISSYTQNTAKVSITGIVVFVCPTCKQPVYNIDRHKTSYYAAEK